jgi:hypothetical protein
MELKVYLEKEIKKLDSKTLFAISGACLVEINSRLLSGKSYIAER